MNSIVEQPSDYRCNMGERAEFYVDCGDSDVLSYQWQYRENQWGNWHNISGEISDRYVFIADGRGFNADPYAIEYHCVVQFTDGTSQTSNDVKVVIGHTFNPQINGMKNGYYYRETNGSSNLITEAQEIHNCNELMTFFKWKGHWSHNFICAVLGNIWAESQVNPDGWQHWIRGDDGILHEDMRWGYSFVQWTPVSVLAEICAKYFPLQPWRSDGLMHAQVLLMEQINEGKPIAERDPILVTSGFDWSAYYDDTVNDIPFLTDKFLRDYLRPDDPDATVRNRIALAEYVNLHVHAYPPAWLLKKFTKEGRKH